MRLNICITESLKNQFIHHRVYYNYSTFWSILSLRNYYKNITKIIWKCILFMTRYKHLKFSLASFSFRSIVPLNVVTILCMRSWVLPKKCWWYLPLYRAANSRVIGITPNSQVIGLLSVVARYILSWVLRRICLSYW